MTFAASPAMYLDHQATTPCDPGVLAEMLPYFGNAFANADSQHAPGRAAKSAVEAAREQVAASIGADPREVIFTSGATEANNLALKGVLQAASPGSRLIVNAAEHSSVLDVAGRLRRRGIDVAILPVDAEGSVSPDAVAQAITDRTVLVSVMLANNEIGTIQDLLAIGRICRAAGVLLHTDAVAGLGRLPVDLSQLPVDLATFSAHKIYGPKGVGALIRRRGNPRIRLEPQIDGGGHEGRLRSGTSPVPLIVGFGVACRLAASRLAEDAAHLEQLQTVLQEELASRFSGLRWNGPATNRLPGNLNVSIEGVDGAALLTALENTLAISSGAACSASNPEASHVLRAIGLPDELCRASLRFGLGRGNTIEQMTTAAEIVAGEVQRLRAYRHERHSV